MMKNSICILFFSLGTPMICGGDEIGRTRKGNNNPYCQDNDISWFNWERLNQNDDIFRFCQKSILFRKRHTILFKKQFYSGVDEDNDTVPDILWFDQLLRTPLWQDPDKKILCYQIDGSEVPSDLGNYHLFFILNAGSEECLVKIPENAGMKWLRVVDTNLLPDADFLDPGSEEVLQNQNEYLSKGKSIVVLIGRIIEDVR